MARLHVLGAWHGPGEEKTARRLARDLPASWDVIAGRQVPHNMSAVDLDLVVVGERGAYVCEEKAWGPHVVVGEVGWYSNGEHRPNPGNQLAHATKVLAGRLREKVGGWAGAQKRLPRGVHPVVGHVVMSHDALRLEGAAELGANVVVKLADAASVLVAEDAALPPTMALLRPALMGYLVGLPQRRTAEFPPMIMMYRVMGKPGVQGNTLTFPAQSPAGEPVMLYCVPVANSENPAEAARLAVRDHDALDALAVARRTWRVQQWFDWEGYRVTPVVVALDGTSLGKLASDSSPQHVDGRVPVEVGVAVVHDAFTALAVVHGAGVLHRALQLRTVEVTPANRVRFRDFSRSKLPRTQTIAPSLDNDHPSAAFQAPGTPLEFLTARDDVYSLALCLAQWLRGDASDQPDHTEAREWVSSYPVVGSLLARCLSPRYDDRPDAAAAAEGSAPEPLPKPTPPPVAPPVSPPPPAVIEPGALLAGRYRIDRTLGEGAWAVTWLAFDEKLGEPRTLKHMRPGRVDHVQVLDEYRHANALRSTRCARPYDVLDEPEPGVLVQEYIAGQTLLDLTAGRDLDAEQFRRIAVDVLRGLADAHEQLVFHRDVSPTNIIVRDDGSAALIDFGLAAKADTAQSAVGSPPFTAPEVWARRHWTPAADIYSACASLLRVMLGRYPYSGPGIDEREVLVPPNQAHFARFGRALLGALYEGVTADPGARPQDAAAYADRILRARDTSVRSGRPMVNPTVAALRGLYRRSGIGNSGNRGMDDAFARSTYTDTLLDTALLPAVIGGELDVVVLSGNPGDGKTSFLVQVGAALDGAGATTRRSDAAGWTKELGARTFSAVYDASESHGDLSSDDLIHAVLAPSSGPHTALLAANDGRIAQFLGDFGDRYPELAVEVDRQRVGEPAEGRIVLVDLKRRALATPDRGSSGLGTDVLSLFTADERWADCEDCTARDVCPIRDNAERLRTPGAREAVSELLLTSHLRRRRRATMRDVRSAFGWLITGDLSCEAVHAENRTGQDPREGAGRRAPDLAFAADTGDYLVEEWRELDPARQAAPAAARAARASRDLVPDLAAVTAESLGRLKRALYFGEWTAPGGRTEVRSYRYFDEYLDALHKPGPALARVLLGLSRILAFPRYEGKGLALQDRTYEDPAVRAIVVVKELPASTFELAAVGAGSGYVESFADRLELRHERGQRLAIALDAAELILRAADGEVLGDPASAALRQEIEGFGQRLRLEPARSVLVVDGAGNRLTAEAVDGRIVGRRQ